MQTQPQVDLLRFQLRQKETAARAVPYVSFILTHVALFLFVVLSFFLNELGSSSVDSLTTRVTLAALAVLFLVSEWMYAIVTSRRWKKDILLLLQLEEERRRYEEYDRSRKREEWIAAEQFRKSLSLTSQQRQHNLFDAYNRARFARSAHVDPSLSMASYESQRTYPPERSNTSQLSSR